MFLLLAPIQAHEIVYILEAYKGQTGMSHYVFFLQYTKPPIMPILEQIVFGPYCTKGRDINFHLG